MHLCVIDGESHGSSSEEHKRDEPSEPGGEDSPIEDIPEHLLEGAMFRVNGGDVGGQGHGARPPRRHLRRQPQTHAVHVPRHEDAPDSARERNHHRVHQERGLQVR